MVVKITPVTVGSFVVIPIKLTIVHSRSDKTPFQDISTCYYCPYFRKKIKVNNKLELFNRISRGIRTVAISVLLGGK